MILAAMALSMAVHAAQPFERVAGRFALAGERYTVVVAGMVRAGDPGGMDMETVERYELRDARGRVRFRRVLATAEILPDGWFAEMHDVSVVELEGAGGSGLLVHHGVIPSAPSSGAAIQVLARRGSAIAPLGPEISVYGRIAPLPAGRGATARRLFRGDTLRFEIWKGHYGVRCELAVDWDRGIRPFRRRGTFAVTASRREADPGSVALHAAPAARSEVRSVRVDRSSDVRALAASGVLVLDERGTLDVEEPWLRVRVDGVEGWVRGEEDLVQLGFPSAG